MIFKVPNEKQKLQIEYLVNKLFINDTLKKKEIKRKTSEFFT